MTNSESTYVSRDDARREVAYHYSCAPDCRAPFMHAVIVHLRAEAAAGPPASAERVWAHVVTEPETEEPALLTDVELAAVNAEMYDLTRNYFLSPMAIRPALPEAAVQEPDVPRIVPDSFPSQVYRDKYGLLSERYGVHLEKGAASVEAEGLDVLQKALHIGYISWDGDGWYAQQAGYGYDEAEAILKEAGAVLSRLLEQREA